MAIEDTVVVTQNAQLASMAMAVQQRALGERQQAVQPYQLRRRSDRHAAAEDAADLRREFAAMQAQLDEWRIHIEGPASARHAGNGKRQSCLP